MGHGTSGGRSARRRSSGCSARSRSRCSRSTARSRICRSRRGRSSSQDCCLSPPLPSSSRATAIGAAALAGLALGPALTLPSLVARQWVNYRPAPGAARAPRARDALPFGAMALATLAYYRTPTLVLGAVGTHAAVARYTIASTLGFGSLALANAITTGLLPRLASLAPELGPALARDSLAWTLRLALLVSRGGRRRRVAAPVADARRDLRRSVPGARRPARLDAADRRERRARHGADRREAHRRADPPGRDRAGRERRAVARCWRRASARSEPRSRRCSRRSSRSRLLLHAAKGLVARSGNRRSSRSSLLRSASPRRGSRSETRGVRSAPGSRLRSC